MRTALVISVVLGFARDPSCGGVDSTASGVNAPCTRDKDCHAGLVCASGVCSSADAGASDAGTDAADALDGDARDDGDG